MTLPQTQSFRNIVKQISPTALQGPNGQMLMYTLAVMYDGLGDAAAYAVRFRFPSYAPDDALTWLGQDRQIARGPSEPKASYVSRLIQWLDLWRTAGSSPSVLRALESFFVGFTIVEGADPMTIETVSDAALAIATPINAWDVGPSDPPTHIETSPPNWNWDTLNEPGRAWIIIFNGPWAQTPTWGAFNWGDGTTYGSNATVSDGNGIRALVAQWKTAGCFVPEIIVAFDPTWFVATNAAGDPKLPDGLWGGWRKVVAGVSVPSRTATAMYLGSVT